MLRVHPAQSELLWDELLPEGVRALPRDLARLDAVLDDPALVGRFRARFLAEGARLHTDPLRRGRPTLSMTTYLWLMVVKQRTGWGYETLVHEVSDSLHLRRFCRIALTAPMPDESTVRKLTRRLGHELLDELTRGLLATALRERRFQPRALRSDSTVVEADVRYPTDSGLCADAVRVLHRVGRAVVAAVPTAAGHVRDRRRSVSRLVRALGRTLGRRTGEAKSEVQRLTEATAERVRASAREARKLAAQARQSRTRAARSPRGVRAIRTLEETAALAERIVEQVRKRFAGEKITDRVVSLFDTDARPVRRGKRAQPTEFGYVVQFTEVTTSTKRGAPALVLPPKLRAGSTNENTLFPESVDELAGLGIMVREAAFDGGFLRPATEQVLQRAGNPKVFIAGSAENAGSRRTKRRRARFRVGCEGRISHLKREYGARRCRLKGTEGARIWEGWAVLAYDLDTISRLPLRCTAS